jgi:hypothetical protein
MACHMTLLSTPASSNILSLSDTARVPLLSQVPSLVFSLIFLLHLIDHLIKLSHLQWSSGNMLAIGPMIHEFKLGQG